MFDWLKKKKNTYTPTREDYSLSEIKEIYKKKYRISFTNYYGYTNLFFKIEDDLSAIKYKRCKEEALSMFREEVCTSKLIKVGLLFNKQLNLISEISKVSSALFELESELKFSNHTLEVLDTCENQHILVFTLDDKWFNNPITLSLILRFLRNKVNEQHLSNRHPNVDKSFLYKLLQKNSPSEIFGSNKKLNWGLTKFKGEFKNVYGDVRFNHDVFAVDYSRIDNKFPKNKVFKLL